MVGCVENWQTIDLAMMMFRAEMLVDYLRVYQRKGSTNVGRNPKSYPMSDYISASGRLYPYVRFFHGGLVMAQCVFRSQRDVDVDEAKESTGVSAHVFCRPLIDFFCSTMVASRRRLYSLSLTKQQK